eukprot:760674-Pleurochrysis_carterae.AAC.1
MQHCNLELLRQLRLALCGWHILRGGRIRRVRIEPLDVEEDRLSTVLGQVVQAFEEAVAPRPHVD